MGASRIAPKLYQGGVPPFGTVLADKGIEVLVLCAEEWQPGPALFPGVEVLACPYADRGDSLTPARLAKIHRTAERVARRVLAERRTLVTCAAGLNRSGLVTALALTMIYGCSGEEAIRWVQRERPGALTNRAFVAFLTPIRRCTSPSAPPPSSPLIILP